MDKDLASGDALNGFVKKIDFTKLKGTSDDYYKAGLAFIENGQFDDGILEYVKVVKTASIDAPSFGQAVKELKRMGFSSADISAITSISESEINQNFKLELQSTSDVTLVQPPKDEMIWLVLLMLTGALLGLLSGLVFVWDQGLYPLPAFGLVGGAIGGIVAGMTRAFSWKFSKKAKIALSISAVVVLLSLFTVFMIFVWPILLIPSLIIFYMTTNICAQLNKSPVNWWLFGILLVVGLVISVTMVGFLSVFSAGFMAQ